MDRRTRVLVLLAVVLVLAAVLSVQAATADPRPVTEGSDGAYPGNTLITVQSYGWFDEDTGRALIVTPSGEVVWEFDPPNSRVFDAEIVSGGNVLVSVATRVPMAECPPAFHDPDRESCVKNRVVELDRPSNRVVWSYAWFDAYVTHHEVHDADRLPSGETVIADMGNHRAFAVDRDGEVTWSWSAEEHLGPGSAFWREHVPETRRDRYRMEGPESDWTHMNDVDRLRNGNVQLSIRNFDVIVEVDPETGEVVSVVGEPGAHDVMREQHDPHRLPGNGTVLVADSENDRVIEVDPDTNEVVWEYVGTETRLQWPRDADRLPNGNTLIVDTLNFRVIEIDENGTVVWSYSLHEERGIPYDADRLGIPEEPDRVPAGGSTIGVGGPGSSVLRSAVAWARFVLPLWVGVPELLALVGLAGASVALIVDGALLLRDRRR